MNTVCLFTQSNRLSQRWNNLLSKDNEVKVCTEFEQVKYFLGERTLIVFHDDTSIETVIKELDLLHEIFPKENTLVLRSQPNLEEGELLLSHKIGGYGNANMSDSVFLQAIEVLKSGSVWLYPELMTHLVKKINKINSNNEIPEILNNLTQREIEVAILVSKGESNQMIADDLHISPNTVKLHISSIFEKLGIKSRVALAILVSKAN
jgi:DNA-binding NarL/FixJ family response regulator